ncbi:hypothetical protein ABK040_013340 [Willaertia magna]
MIFRKLNNNEKAVELYMECIQANSNNQLEDEEEENQLNNNSTTTTPISSSLVNIVNSTDEANIYLYLANYFFDMKEYNSTKHFCLQLMDDRFNGLPERDHAMLILHQMKNHKPSFLTTLVHD